MCFGDSQWNTRPGAHGSRCASTRNAPEAAAGFDYFAIGVPDEASIRSLAGHLSSLGEQHAGVHWATIGWILPTLHDPDGHEVRFYTQQHHTEVPQGSVVRNPCEAAEARERERQDS